MYRHLDDPAPPEADGRSLTYVLQRAEGLRARTRRRFAIATVGVAACVVALAAVVVAVRPSPAGAPGTNVHSRQTNYDFNQRGDPLPAGTPVPTTTLIDVVFVGRTDGFALADHRNQLVLAATTDGGTSWTVVNGDLPSTVASGGAAAEMEFTSSGAGYLWRGASAGDAGAPMWVTDDGGTSWSKAPIGPVVYDVSAIGTSVWALSGSCGPGVAVCRVVLDESTDGGVGTTWAGAPAAVTLTLDAPSGTSAALPTIQLARVNLERAYVFSSAPTGHSTLVFTTDAGATWSPRLSTCGGEFGAGGQLALSSTDDLWLVCGGAASGGSQAKILYRSSDGGASWRVAAATPPAPGGTPITPTAGVLALQGYVAPYSIGHKTLAVLSATAAWLFPTGGTVSVTVDGGQTWSPAAGLQTADFGSGGPGNVTFIDADDGWVVEFGVGLWRTTNAVTWQAVGS